jgi:hypothetical protein
MPAAAPTSPNEKRDLMAVVIGVDPHKTPYGCKCQGVVDNFSH